jgi:hypothetical protein
VYIPKTGPLSLLPEPQTISARSDMSADSNNLITGEEASSAVGVFIALCLSNPMPANDEVKLTPAEILELGQSP